MTLTEVMVSNPIVSIAIVAVLVMLISTLAHKFLTDQNSLKSLKARQKEIQKKLKGEKDAKVLRDLNSEMMSITGKMFKASMKPMFITLIPFLILFIWLRGVYQPTMGNSWIWWYIGFGLVSSIILRKIFKVA